MLLIFYNLVTCMFLFHLLCCLYDVYDA
uniref:Uncharacterized protein n=1 Tax=Rhizophora mucronata TaxID=61149 RepID=A0A2P2QTJ1_RHIMU